MSQANFAIFLSLAFLIHISGCLFQAHEKTEDRDNIQHSRSQFPSILRLMKERENCQLTEEDRFVLTYLGLESSRLPTMSSWERRWERLSWTVQDAFDYLLPQRFPEKITEVHRVRLTSVKHVDYADLPKIVGTRFLSYDPPTNPNVRCCVEALVEWDKRKTHHFRYLPEAVDFLAAKRIDHRTGEPSWDFLFTLHQTSSQREAKEDPRSQKNVSDCPFNEEDRLILTYNRIFDPDAHIYKLTKAKEFQRDLMTQNITVRNPNLVSLRHVDCSGIPSDLRWEYFDDYRPDLRRDVLQDPDVVCSAEAVVEWDRGQGSKYIHLVSDFLAAKSRFGDWYRLPHENNYTLDIYKTQAP